MPKMHFPTFILFLTFLMPFFLCGDAEGMILKHLQQHAQEKVAGAAINHVVTKLSGGRMHELPNGFLFLTKFPF